MATVWTDETKPTTGWTQLEPFEENNLLTNSGFELWTLGDSVAPDGWTLEGAGGTIAREGTIKKLGSYSAAVTRNGADVLLRQPTIHLDKGIAYWQGRTVTVSGWVYATVADKVRLVIYDAVVGTVYSSFHTGDSTWQLLTATKTIAPTGSMVDVWG